MNNEYPTFLNTPAKRAKWKADKRARRALTTPHRIRANPNAPITTNQYPPFLNTAAKRAKWKEDKRAKREVPAIPPPARVPFANLERKRAALRKIQEERARSGEAIPKRGTLDRLKRGLPAIPAPREAGPAPEPKKRGRPKVKKIDKLKAEYKEAKSLAEGEGGGTQKKRKPNKFNLAKERKEFEEMHKRHQKGEPAKSKKSLEEQKKEFAEIAKKLPKKKAESPKPKRKPATPPPKRKPATPPPARKAPAKEEKKSMSTKGLNEAISKLSQKDQNKIGKMKKEGIKGFEIKNIKGLPHLVLYYEADMLGTTHIIQKKFKIPFKSEDEDF